MYDHIGEAKKLICTIDDLGTLEFVDFEGNKEELTSNSYKQSIETDFGTLYVYNDIVFCFENKNGEAKRYFQLVGGTTFSELMSAADYPYLSLETQFVLKNSGFNVFTFNAANESGYQLVTMGSLNNTSQCIIRVYSQIDRKLVYETRSGHPIDEVLELEQGQYFVVVELIDADDQAIILSIAKQSS